MKSSFFAAFLRKRRNGTIRSPEECLRLCAQAGFDCIDYSPDYSLDTWREEAEAAADASGKYGGAEGRENRL